MHLCHYSKWIVDAFLFLFWRFMALAPHFIGQLLRSSNLPLHCQTPCLHVLGTSPKQQNYHLLRKTRNSS